uniref:Phosphopantothenoylcysteine decarboxylase n=1 Tax=Bursaphelenchus xylophilus TaxID=6326 RepID=A0A1I7RSS3_BURXY
MGEDEAVVPEKRPRYEVRRAPFDSRHRLTQSLDKFHLLIGVTGSVATIKIEELVADLRKKYDEDKLVIKVIATQSALHFFDPTKLEEQNIIVYEDRDEWNMFKKRGDPVLHIDLRKWANAFLIAPLDANTLAKVSNGQCDNLLTCVARAWDFNKPFFFAPAMNTCMWEHPITAEQVRKLGGVFGCKEIPPIEKELMCGDKGYGAMAKVSMISSIIISAIRDKFAVRSQF